MTIETIFNECLLKKNEPTTDIVKAEGIITTVFLKESSLQKNKNEIEKLLKKIPDNFQISIKDTKWTSSHQKLEKLFQLGIGIGTINVIRVNGELYHIINNQ
ncbi:MAG: hypothetical protein WCT51_02050 [Candidatus Shapirobacteria bacterium]|jgi:hypothetical protein